MASSFPLGKLDKVPVYNPVIQTVETLLKRVHQFRPCPARLPVTNQIESCCFNPPAMRDYLQEYQTFLTHAKWKFRLVESARLDLDRAWIRLTKLKFWVVEECDNIGRAYVFRFEDYGPSKHLKVQFGNLAEILGMGLTFRDGDLCYCFKEQNDCLLVTELFYLETITWKSGFVEYGTHKWVPSDVKDWKSSISNLYAVYYFHEQPGSFKVYNCYKM